MTPNWHDWALVKNNFSFNDSCDTQPHSLASATSVVTWDFGEAGSQAPMFGLALSERMAPMREVSSHGDGNHRPWGHCPLLFVFIFNTCLMRFFILFLLHCCDLLAIIWFLYEKKLCYRNQHTIFLNLERRYYGDWKYGQVSNINVQKPSCCRVGNITFILYLLAISKVSFLIV